MVCYSVRETVGRERENRVRESFSIGGLLRPTFKTKLTATIFLNELIKTIQKNNWIFSTYFSVFLFSIFFSFFSFFFFFSAFSFRVLFPLFRQRAVACVLLFMECVCLRVNILCCIYFVFFLFFYSILI